MRTRRLYMLLNAIVLARFRTTNNPEFVDKTENEASKFHDLVRADKSTMRG